MSSRKTPEDQENQITETDKQKENPNSSQESLHPVTYVIEWLGK